MTGEGATSERVRAVLARHVSTRSAEEIEDGDELGADLGLDSLDCIELAIDLENELEVGFGDDEGVGPEMTVEMLGARVARAVAGRAGVTKAIFQPVGQRFDRLVVLAEAEPVIRSYPERRGIIHRSRRVVCRC